MAGSKGGDGDENLTANDPLLAVSENLDYIQDGAEVPQVECEQNTDISIDQDLSLAEQDGIVEQMCERDGIVRVSKVCEQDSISGNDSEEVDDIELIFTTDDTKELHGLQEDLVSITEGDKWPSRDTITAPIVRFTKDSDAPVCRKGVLRSHREARSLQSDDSCSFDRLRSFSFENNRTSGSSFDAVTGDSSFDHREDSLERLDVLASQYSVDVFAERDISKCGVDSFPDVARRNTCPDPPRYRPLAHREAVYGGRPGLGGLAPPAAPLRAPRRSSAAQTDVTALPDRWRSDTHLARKIVQSAPTVPCEGGTRKVADRPLPEIQTTRRSEEARRVLLSDIGFTSMVPELSRSAEPVWAGALPPACCANSFSCIKEAPCFTSRFGSSLFQRSVSSSLLRCMQQVSRGGWRGSLPELRAEGEHCAGQHMLQQQQQQESSHHNGSTEELLDEADRFLRRSIDCISSATNREDGELCPSQHSRPYLPSGPRQLRLGHLAKVIAPHGRIALGKVRYVGVAGGAGLVYVGLQLSPSSGGGDGCFRGRRYFLCPSGRSLFVPFSKVIMAWADR